MSGKPRSPIFTVATPYPDAPTVTLMDNTWSDHIVAGHPEMGANLEAVKNTLQGPDVVCTVSNPDYYGFVSSSHTNSKGHPLLVVVSPVDTSGDPVVATAYHSRKHQTVDPKSVKWKP